MKRHQSRRFAKLFRPKSTPEKEETTRLEEPEPESESESDSKDWSEFRDRPFAVLALRRSGISTTKWWLTFADKKWGNISESGILSIRVCATRAGVGSLDLPNLLAFAGGGRLVLCAGDRTWPESDAAVRYWLQVDRAIQRWTRVTGGPPAMVSGETMIGLMRLRMNLAMTCPVIISTRK